MSPGLRQMLRAEAFGAATQSAVTWLKPLTSTPGAIHIPADDATLGRLGPLEVRLAQAKRDIRRAQKLRYRVFYRDGAAIADAATLLARRDKDAFDRICDHLLVIDHAATLTPRGLRPVVDRVFPFEQAPAAFAHLASGAHFGKVVVAVG